MLLVIDVGNTNTVLGVYHNDTLVKHWRLQTHHGRTSDEHGILLRQLFEIAGIGLNELKHAIISCVVPPMERMIVSTIRDYCGLTPVVVGDSIHAQIPILLDNPREVGADRIVNAVAAWHRHRCSLVVVDFGTATTFDAISHAGEYLGGAICPGITISSEALFRAASRLPRVELAKPQSVIGRTTVQAIQAGLLFGYTGLVREIVHRMKAELTGPTRVVATGGLARYIASETDIIDEVDEFLTLEGLRLIHLSQETTVA
ncbi:MAG: type III pantothenate kinase [Bradymonadaceae bacterium]|nr:type III pantothenate kinase [Lujinxingiaceae bacterium]